MEARTENNALSYATIGYSRVDFFFKTVRDTSAETLHTLLTDSWNECPLDTLKLIFHLRDCRGGKGEKKQFFNCMQWLLANHPEAVHVNLESIPFYGSFKDWLQFFNTSEEEHMLTCFTQQLREDRDKLTSTDPKVKNSISLAAKWAPTEGCSHDTKYDAACKFAKALRCRKVDYRKQYVAPLRQHLKLVETMMCTGQWDSIDFSKVPSCALKRYKKSFEKHSPELYKSFLERVKTGQAKMNVGQLHPHEILKPYLEHCSSGNPSCGITAELDETVETQWVVFVERIRKSWGEKGLGNCLAISDVSGSMSGLPIVVSVALGMLVAELTTGPFHNKWITFSTNPVLEELRGKTCHEKINNMMKSSWSMSTNIQAVFDLVLNSAKMFKVSQEQMPTSLIILSDMEFNSCQHEYSYHGKEKTNYQEIERKYAEAGYKRPRLIFWNLRGNQSQVNFPATKDVPNCAMVSGFSSDLLEIFLDGENLNPYQVMRKCIDNCRYDKVRLTDC